MGMAVMPESKISQLKELMLGTQLITQAKIKSAVLAYNC